MYTLVRYMATLPVWEVPLASVAARMALVDTRWMHTVGKESVNICMDCVLLRII
jgi:hypothetical protein